MNNECANIDDLMLAYMNKTIGSKDIVILMDHLSKCSKCRENLLDFLILQNSLSSSLEEVPQRILNNLYAQLPENSSEIALLKSKYLEPLVKSIDNVFTPLNLAKKTLNLAFQFI